MKREQLITLIHFLFILPLLTFPSSLHAEKGIDLLSHYYDDVNHIDGAPIGVEFDSVASKITLEIRVSPIGRERPSEWGVCWTGCDGVRWDLEISPVTEWKNEDTPSVGLTLRSDHRKMASKFLTKGVAFDHGANTLVIEWEDESVTVYYGSEYPEELFSTESPLPRDRVTIASSKPLAVEDLIVEEGVPAWRKVTTEWTPERISAHMRTAIRPEGIYTFLDRENDPKYVRLGGRYSLAVIRDGANGYLLLYNGGAETNGSQWRPGMVKGRLTATQFPGQYNLVWYDATFTDRGDEGYATFDEDSRLLSVYFPVLKATLRFARSSQR